MSTTEIFAAPPRPGLEHPDCPLCHGRDRAFPYELSEGYRVARCQTCGTHYLYPRLTEEAMQLVYQDPTYYQGGRSGYADTSYFDQETALRATFKCVLRNLQTRGMTGGDLLEVGCGYGYLLDESRNYFRRRAGTEFSPEAAAHARENGADVFLGGIETLPSDAMFDCALAIQVIEHIYDPIRFMNQLVTHITPGGYVLLATPDIGGALRKVMGKSWPSFKVPEHVVYFDFQTLQRLMTGAGLIGVTRFPYPHAFPLGLIAAKFGLSLPQTLARINTWIPATTVAAFGRISHD
ncbi:MAG TPA: class I SAM-dependent methyltransferase [Chthoniobacterales bacterium]|nr:class I SAM-dependent methyltransferase [Chthoniobacterales bacterium]